MEEFLEIQITKEACRAFELKVFATWLHFLVENPSSFKKVTTEETISSCTDFDCKQIRLPTFLLNFGQQTRVLTKLFIVPLIHVLFAGASKFHENNLFTILRIDNNIWSKGGGGDTHRKIFSNPLQGISRETLGFYLGRKPL